MKNNHGMILETGETKVEEVLQYSWPRVYNFILSTITPPSNYVNQCSTIPIGMQTKKSQQTSNRWIQRCNEAEKNKINVSIRDLKPSYIVFQNQNFTNHSLWNVTFSPSPLRLKTRGKEKHKGYRIDSFKCFLPSSLWGQNKYIARQQMQL